MNTLRTSRSLTAQHDGNKMGGTRWVRSEGVRMDFGPAL